MKTIHWISGFLLLTSITWIIDATAQNTENTAKPPLSTQTTIPQTLDWKRIDLVATEIKRQQPRIPDQVLTQDAILIRHTFPTITADYWALGLTEDDALWASLRAWKSARLESPLRNFMDSPMNESSFIDHATNEIGTKVIKWRIRNENPEIKPHILAKDLRLIVSAQAELSVSFEKRGLDASTARRASLFAWAEVRLNSPLGSFQLMNRVSFVAFAESTGIVVFDSEPDQADVFMGNNRIGTTSRDKGRRLQRTFENGKTLTVSFSKAGFLPATRDCVVRGRDTVECKVELRPNQ